MAAERAARRPAVSAVAIVMIVCAGCSITQDVRPVPPSVEPDVCVIENPAVRPLVLGAYMDTLARRGYRVRVVRDAAADECPLTSTYVARWSWDMKPYMGYARIDVLRHGQTIGEAVYDCHASASFDRYVEPRAKITELVEQLYPSRDGGAR